MPERATQFTRKHVLADSGGTITRPEVREMLASLARNRVRLGGKHQTGCSRDVGRSDQTKFPVRLGGAITRPGAQRYVRQSSQNYVLIKSGGAVAEPNTRESFTQSTQKYFLVESGGASTNVTAREGRPSFTHKYALAESGGTIARPEVREMLASLPRNSFWLSRAAEAPNRMSERCWRV